MNLEITMHSGDKHIDDAVTSVVGNNGKVMIFTEDYAEHYKYLIEGNYARRYELTTSFFRQLPISTWRVIP